ncbi:methyl-accepting chemotaxis protein [Methanofollis sp. W23]|uniref:methyl-accepting chemotaxis protein n=1 Tax=Methanofollis sp. W23 TaxID=2817849 RepID=UPI001AE35213|nr:methyl-accepting chemotaxis protein [Methanofollis sp. W23]MBP2146901.1 methyl-accepting chemotaxis protein [Methanofollis sp. W23]
MPDYTDIAEGSQDGIARTGVILKGMDQVPAPIQVIDPEYRILYLNQAAADLVGVRAEDCVGKPCYAIFGNNLCNSEGCPCRNAMKTGQTEIARTELAGGCWIDCTGAPLKDDSGEIIGAVEFMQDVGPQVRAVRDLLEVGEETQQGNLSARANLNAEGDFREIAENVNALLDTVTEPLQVASTVIEQIGRGEIPEKVEGDYEGDFKALIDDINHCINGLAALSGANAVLKRMALNDYTLRVEGDFHGIYADIAAEINMVIDRLVTVQNVSAHIAEGDLSDLDDLKTVGKRSENDKILPALITMEESITALIKDSEQLAEAGAAGNLSVRADVTRHKGSFAEAMNGVNCLFDVIVQPLNEGMKIAAALADGDYTRPFSEDIQVSGDFKRFKDSLNEIIFKGSAVFTKVQGAAEQVQYGTLEASKGGDQIAKAAEQVANTSQQCADLNKTTLTKMEEISRQISDLSASNEEVASTSQEILSRSELVAQKGRDTQGLGREANEKITVVEKIANESVEDITQLNDEMHEINKIVKLITDISNQTNLLALNAAIEAARAGEHGRGFAVVAGEVRNLAGESKKATDDIENLITSIQGKSEKTATAIRSANDEITASVQSVNGAIEALNEIVEGAVAVTHDMSEIARAIEDQANTTNNVVQIVEDGTRMTRESLNQIEDLAALAEETSASTEEIGSAVHELNRLAADLDEEMKKFRV